MRFAQPGSRRLASTGHLTCHRSGININTKANGRVAEPVISQPSCKATHCKQGPGWVGQDFSQGPLSARTFPPPTPVPPRYSPPFPSSTEGAQIPHRKGARCAAGQAIFTQGSGGLLTSRRVSVASTQSCLGWGPKAPPPGCTEPELHSLVGASCGLFPCCQLPSRAAPSPQAFWNI